MSTNCTIHDQEENNNNEDFVEKLDIEIIDTKNDTVTKTLEKTTSVEEKYLEKEDNNKNKSSSEKNDKLCNDLETSTVDETHGVVINNEDAENDNDLTLSDEKDSDIYSDNAQNYPTTIL
jgi:hypothetical protein